MIIFRMPLLIIAIYTFLYSLLCFLFKSEPTVYLGCWPPEPSFMDRYAAAINNSPVLFMIASIAILVVIYFTYHISFANVVRNKSSFDE